MCTPGVVGFVFRLASDENPNVQQPLCPLACRETVSVVSGSWLLVGCTMKFTVCLLTSTMRSAAVTTSPKEEVFAATSIECIPTGRRSNHKDLKNSPETITGNAAHLAQKLCWMMVAQF